MRAVNSRKVPFEESFGRASKTKLELDFILNRANVKAVDKLNFGLEQYLQNQLSFDSQHEDAR